MDFDVRVERRGIQHVLIPRGEIDLATVGVLRDALTHAYADAAEVWVDLSEVEFMDSTALSALVEAHGIGPLTVICPDGHPRRVLKVSGVDQVLRVLADRPG